MVKKKKKEGKGKSILPQGGTEGYENLLVSDLKELIQMVESNQSVEDVIDKIEEVYANVLAMRITSFPPDEQHEVLKEDMNFLAEAIKEMMLLYLGKGGSEDEGRDIPPVEKDGDTEAETHEESDPPGDDSGDGSIQ